MKRRITYPVEVLWCGNSRGKGWSFPVAVRDRLQADFKGKSVLHLFGGRATFGTRLDIDPLTQPDVLGDAWVPPFGKDSFDVVILDPPYFLFNAMEKNSLFRGSAWIAKETVVWFHTIWASQAQGLKTERAWLVRCGDQNYVRCLQYFNVYRKPETPARYFGRGPAMKYNRWLNQPQGFAFEKAEASCN